MKLSKDSASREFNFFTTAVSWKKKAKKFKQREPKLSVKESFYMEFAEEIDLFSLEGYFPDWVLRFREERLRDIDGNFRRMCRKLGDIGEKFYIQYPIEKDGKWKYADVFLPLRNTVIILLGFSTCMHSPCNVRFEREKWFSDKYRVIGIYPDELGMLAEKIKSDPSSQTSHLTTLST